MDATFTATADRAAETAQATAAQATQAAGAAADRGQAMFAELGEFGRGNLAALAESGRIAAQGMEAMGQHAAAFVRGRVEDAQAQARSLAGAASPADFLRLQGDFARAQFDKLVAETSRGTEAALKLAGEVAQPLSNRMALAAERFKAAA